ncbi:MAG: hypothetical protein Q9196_004296 [Gyalolechia fulgens]
MLVESLSDHSVQRDTGQWLPIAESAQAVNNICVAGEHSGGMEETGETFQGDNKRLLISLYQPGSPQDMDIERSREHGDRITMPMIRDEDENSIDDDLDDLQNHFASLLNIHEDPNYPKPLRTWEGEFGHFHIGKSDPQVKNLGNNWELRYNSVTGLLPTNHAARGLSPFYLHIVEIAAEKIASNATSLNVLNLRSNGLSLNLDSPAPIPWEWIIRFAREMLEASKLGWTVLYDASARNAYWDLAVISAALRLASTLGDARVHR